MTLSWHRLLAGLLLAGAPGSATAQSSPILSSALALAQEGRIDSARSVLRQLEATTAPTDSLFPGILYSSALVSKDAAEARTRLQRVVAEYPVSPWAGESMIRLAQLDYANGDPAAAARQLDRFRTDHAASPLYSIAAVWGARAAFDASDATAACQWVNEGLARSPSDAARAELVTLARRCGPSGPAVTSTDTVKSPAAAATVVPSTTPRPGPSAPPAGPSAAAPTARPAWRVQVAAAASSAAAAQILERARGAGFDGLILEEGGYHKVRLGSYATRAEATAALTKVRATLGGTPFVVGP